MKGWSFALAVVATIVVAQAAWAKPYRTLREIQEEACTKDAMALCKEFLPDEGKIEACMERKKAQLSPQCAAMFSTDAN